MVVCVDAGLPDCLHTTAINTTKPEERSRTFVLNILSRKHRSRTPEEVATALDADRNLLCPRYVRRP